jgi:pimeloyl-ACP methyl ester carboxylesterase
MKKYVSIILIILIILYYYQDTLIYPGMSINDLVLNDKLKLIENGEYRSYYLEPLEKSSKSMKLWIFFTGNNMISKDYHKFAKLIQNSNKNDAILLYEYPGFGLNNGKGELSMHENKYIIEKYVKKLKGIYDISSINLFSWSLGCAVSLDYAKNNQLINNIYLLAPFTTFQRAIRHNVKGLPLDCLISSKNKWDNIQSVLEINPKKITVFHGTLDVIVPFEHGLELFNNIPKGIVKKFIKLENIGHSLFYNIDYTKIT